MDYWDNIKEVLKIIYTQNKLIEHFDKDEVYLKNAFEKTEKLWINQFKQIERINYLMISEAPLFGKIEKFIYNVKTEPSSFFYYNDLKAFPNIDFLDESLTAQEQKEKILSEFNKAGFLIFDLFPLALNQTDTIINFRHMKRSLYNTILRETTPYFLMPKLELCTTKFSPNVQIFYRYKRLFKKTGNHFELVLKQVTKREFTIDTINGENMSLDRVKLKQILLK